jgi:hypothetical protein
MLLSNESAEALYADVADDDRTRRQRPDARQEAAVAGRHIEKTIVVCHDAAEEADDMTLLQAIEYELRAAIAAP